jgi:hypothetical protein
MEYKRLTPISNKKNDDNNDDNGKGGNDVSTEIKQMDSTNRTPLSPEMLTQVTIEADRVATYHLGTILFPLAVGFALRSLIMEKHSTWYDTNVYIY